MKTILIIEDDRDIRECLHELMEFENYRSIVASNGAEGFSILQNAKSLPDLILLDWTMPVMNGAEFLNKKAMNSKLIDIPVIVLSASQHAKMQSDIKEVITKPIDLDSLLDVIKLHIAD